MYVPLLAVSPARAAHVLVGARFPPPKRNVSQANESNYLALRSYCIMPTIGFRSNIEISHINLAILTVLHHFLCIHRTLSEYCTGYMTLILIISARVGDRCPQACHLRLLC